MAIVELPIQWATQTWMDLANCKDQTEHFFAPHGEQAEAREAREGIAGAICNECEVLLACREFARRHREQGFWGGENDDQRIAVRRRANRMLRSGLTAHSA
jgi:WhiB family redox-sensing transcriptional regulator